MHIYNSTVHTCPKSSREKNSGNLQKDTRLTPVQGDTWRTSRVYRQNQAKPNKKNLRSFQVEEGENYTSLGREAQQNRHYFLPRARHKPLWLKTKKLGDVGAAFTNWVI